MCWCSSCPTRAPPGSRPPSPSGATTTRGGRCRERRRPRSPSGAARRCGARCRLPGCKGVSHRALFAAAIADGRERAGQPRHRARRREHPGRPRAASGVPITDVAGRPGPGRAAAGSPGWSSRPRCSTAATRGPPCGSSAGCAPVGRSVSVLVGDASLVAAADGPGARAAAGDGRRRRRPRRRPPRAAGDPRRRPPRGAPRPRGGERPGEDGARARRAPGRRDHRDRRAGAQSRPHRAAPRRARRPGRGRRRAHHPGRDPVGCRRSTSTCPATRRRPRSSRSRRRVVPGSHLVLEGVLGNPGRIALPRRAAGDGRRRSTVRDRGERAGEPVVDLEVAAAPLRGVVIAQPRGDHRRAPRAGRRRGVRRRRRPRSATPPSCG